MRPFLAFLLLLFAGMAQAVELRLEPIKIETAKGVFDFQAEVAETAEQRAVGLMHRKTMAPDRAMLFDFGRPRPVFLWMKNTFISLDMIFVKPDGTVASIARNTVPQSLDVIPSGVEVNVAIEVIAGTADRIGLAEGDKVRHRIFGNAG